MRRLFLSAFAACLASLAAAPLERSISISRQFIVYGPDARLRAAVCDVAEQTKTSALHLLGERDAWKTPIVIDAHYPEANSPETPPAQLAVSQTGFGLKLQLQLVIGGEVNGQRAEREILRAIFLEMMYRGQPQVAPGTAYAQPPDWLLDGALALAPGNDATEIAQALRTAVNSSGVLSLEDFLQQRPALMESPSRKIYRAYSAALVSLLIDLPNGRQRLARFLADRPHSVDDSLGDLSAHFPNLGENADAVQKKWVLNVARVSGRDQYGLLSCEETERQLAQTLQLQIAGQNQVPTVFGLEEFSTFLSRPSAKVALLGLRQQLLLLSGRAHPLYRPIVAEYLELVRLLQHKKTKHLTERLAKIRGTREHMSRRMSEIDDYLNWFEATQSHSKSGAFREYLQAAQSASETESRRPRSHFGLPRRARSPAE
ncbi:MAG: hypothetical protein M3128_05930 [Verrucomicrobiota bacterium]|nr:hypothetical protein [Verrucomicrobiota bacterium]